MLSTIAIASFALSHFLGDGLQAEDTTINGVRVIPIHKSAIDLGVDPQVNFFSGLAVKTKAKSEREPYLLNFGIFTRPELEVATGLIGNAQIKFLARRQSDGTMEVWGPSGKSLLPGVIPSQTSTVPNLKLGEIMVCVEQNNIPDQVKGLRPEYGFVELPGLNYLHIKNRTITTIGIIKDDLADTRDIPFKINYFEPGINMLKVAEGNSVRQDQTEFVVKQVEHATTNRKTSNAVTVDFNKNTYPRSYTVRPKFSSTVKEVNRYLTTSSDSTGQIDRQVRLVATPPINAWESIEIDRTTQFLGYFGKVQLKPTSPNR